MHVPSAMELLDAWEAGQSLPPVQRALALLMVTRPDASHQVLAEMSIGSRDAELLSLREHLFGSVIVALTSCPDCGARCEVALQADDVRTPPRQHSVFDVATDGYVVRARPANSRDVTAADGESHPEAQERRIIAGCTLEARCGETSVAVDAFPDTLVEAIARAMSEADPQADVHVTMACPACGHQWQAEFDVAAFLWREIDAWAKRALDEVHTLAFAYGWSQSEILSMSASRRRRYVSMIAQA